MRLVFCISLALSAFGTALSVVVHFSALWGIKVCTVPCVLCLHAGIFVLSIPYINGVYAVGGATTKLSLSDITQASARYWKFVKSCPRWMRNISYGLFAYFVINFLVLIFYTSPRVGAAGKDLRSMPPAVLLFFSSGWLVIYFMFFAFFLAAVRANRCLYGHLVPLGLRCCEQCDAPTCE
jgi:hypothetical protein